jgi:hypothetical protein
MALLVGTSQKPDPELKTPRLRLLDREGRRRVATSAAPPRKEWVMNKRLAAMLILVLGLVGLAGGCNGANEVTGPGDGTGRVVPPTPNVTPHVRPTPNPCRQNPADCD